MTDHCGTYTVSFSIHGASVSREVFTKKSVAKRFFDRLAAMEIENPQACVLLTRDRDERCGTVIADKCRYASHVALHPGYFAKDC